MRIHLHHNAVVLTDVWAAEVPVGSAGDLPLYVRVWDDVFELISISLGDDALHDDDPIGHYHPVETVDLTGRVTAVEEARDP